MKKVIKWILISAAGLVVLFLALMLITNYPLLSMAPASTGEISGTTIFAVKNNFTTVYFIKTDSGYILIDAGTSSGSLASSLKKSGIDTAAVKWIFLTHSDGDHVAALPLFTNAKIYMGNDEFPLINGTVYRSGSRSNSLPSGIDINKIELLSGEQELLCDTTVVKCIQAPGHTPGSLLYMIDDRYLFTGDAFKIKNGDISVHPFTMNKELSKKTIEHLTETVNNSPLVLTAHYGYFKKGI